MRNIYQSLPGITLLVKISTYLTPILGSYGQEMPQNQPQIILSPSLITFKI